MNITDKQEEALCALYEAWGYETAMGDVLKHLKTKFSDVHSVVIDARKVLTDKANELREKSNKLSDESKLTDLLMYRVDKLEKK